MKSKRIDDLLELAYLAREGKQWAAADMEDLEQAKTTVAAAWVRHGAKAAGESAGWIGTIPEREGQIDVMAYRVGGRVLVTLRTAEASVSFVAPDEEPYDRLSLQSVHAHVTEVKAMAKAFAAWDGELSPTKHVRII